jgi:hypothetical protein
LVSPLNKVNARILFFFSEQVEGTVELNTCLCGSGEVGRKEKKTVVGHFSSNGASINCPHCE